MKCIFHQSLSGCRTLRPFQHIFNISESLKVISKNVYEKLKLLKISFKILTRLNNERSILLKIENYSFFHSLSMLLRKKGRS